jgi:hypothetical protein
MLEPLLSDRDVEKITGRARSTCKKIGFQAPVSLSSGSVGLSATANPMCEPI